MASKEQIKEKYEEFKLLQEHIEKISEHINLLTEQQIQIEQTTTALEDIKKVELGTEILVPLADGLFIKANLKDTTEVLVNVGAETIVPRSIDQIKNMLKIQQEKVTQNIEEAKILLEQFETEAMGIYREVEQHVQ